MTNSWLEHLLKLIELTTSGTHLLHKQINLVFPSLKLNRIWQIIELFQNKLPIVSSVTTCDPLLLVTNVKLYLYSLLLLINLIKFNCWFDADLEVDPFL